MSNYINEQLNLPLEAKEDSTTELTPAKTEQVFIPCEMDQLCLPLSLEELIPANHVVQIAKAVRENIPFMWLSARQTPDFRTINWFQTKIKQLLHEIDEVERKEQEEYGSQDLEELGEESAVTAEKLEAAVTRLEQKLGKEPKTNSS